MRKPKPYPLAGEHQAGNVRDSAERRLTGMAPVKPYPVWSWQKRRKWLQDTWAEFAIPEPEDSPCST